ncbi:hypothetical protein RR48_00157, partial [Papilio machaon]
HDKVDGKWQFTCQHGPDECYGNKVQACILKDRSLQDTDKMELVMCLMSNASPDKSLDTGRHIRALHPTLVPTAPLYTRRPFTLGAPLRPTPLYAWRPFTLGAPLRPAPFYARRPFTPGAPLRPAPWAVALP